MPHRRANVYEQLEAALLPLLAATAPKLPEPRALALLLAATHVKGATQEHVASFIRRHAHGTELEALIGSPAWYALDREARRYAAHSSSRGGQGGVAEFVAERALAKLIAYPRVILDGEKVPAPRALSTARHAFAVLALASLDTARNRGFDTVIMGRDRLAFLAGLGSDNTARKALNLARAQRWLHVTQMSRGRAWVWKIEPARAVEAATVAARHRTVVALARGDRGIDRLADIILAADHAAITYASPGGLSPRAWCLWAATTAGLDPTAYGIGVTGRRALRKALDTHLPGWSDDSELDVFATLDELAASTGANECRAEAEARDAERRAATAANRVEALAERRRRAAEKKAEQQAEREAYRLAVKTVARVMVKAAGEAPDGPDDVDAAAAWLTVAWEAADQATGDEVLAARADAAAADDEHGEGSDEATAAWLRNGQAELAATPRVAANAARRVLVRDGWDDDDAKRFVGRWSRETGRVPDPRPTHGPERQTETEEERAA
ncbi:hypothetical protein OMK64_01705 [Cellulomonas fimi]|uniref:hypothetical protein n=1 Tax=Cellulomonas fimi TaxID=1708 RepID=UPI00234D46F1|nr:hypothetical protein [Cellulomonas fimi]MDC7120247.1 hypothetical protein [Cellulomonas fimi]